MLAMNCVVGSVVTMVYYIIYRGHACPRKQHVARRQQLDFLRKDCQLDGGETFFLFGWLPNEIKRKWNFAGLVGGVSKSCYLYNERIINIIKMIYTTHDIHYLVSALVIVRFVLFGSAVWLSCPDCWQVVLHAVVCVSFVFFGRPSYYLFVCSDEDFFPDGAILAAS